MKDPQPGLARGSTGPKTKLILTMRTIPRSSNGSGSTGRPWRSSQFAKDPRRGERDHTGYNDSSR